MTFCRPLNSALRSVLRRGIMRLNVYIDDFYFVPIAYQPELLDYAFATLRDWMRG